MNGRGAYVSDASTEFVVVDLPWYVALPCRYASYALITTLKKMACVEWEAIDEAATKGAIDLSE